MHNIKKRVAALALSLLLTFSYLPLSALAAVEGNDLPTNGIAVAENSATGLVPDGAKYRFIEADGKAVTSDWREVNGIKYYFDFMGLSVKGWYYINSQKHYFHNNFNVATGTQIIDNVVYSFDADGKLMEEIVQGLHKDVTTDSYFYITDKKGTLAKNVFKEQANEGYYLDKNGFTVKGKQIISEEIYIFGEDYKLVKGLNTDPQDPTKKFYITNGKGERLRNAWSSDVDAAHYFDAQGFAVKGWHGIGDAQYYFGNDYLPYKNGKFTIVDKEFEFDSQGKLVTTVVLGLQTDEKGNLFFVTNASGEIAKNQWQIVGTDAYYFGDDTFAVKGEQSINNEVLIFADDSKLKQGLSTDSNGNLFYIKDATAKRVKSDWSPDTAVKHYFNELGNAVTGWLTLGDFKYYFDTNFLPVTGAKEIDGKPYKFDEQGRLISEAKLGLNAVEVSPGITKYVFIKDNLGVKAKNEWQKADAAVYYFDNEGYSVNGRQVINDEIFAFETDYKLKLGVCLDTDNGNIFFMENTDRVRSVSKWQTVGDAKYYFNEKGIALKDRQVIDEKIYIFGTDGKMKTGLVFDYLAPGGTRPIYVKDLEGNRGINEWIGTGEDKYFFAYNGYGARGWNYIGKDLYYFHNNCKPAQGTQLVENKVYTFDENGKVLTSGAKSGVFLDEKAPGGSKYYYIAPNTQTPAINTWYSDSEKAYYFGADGYSVKGRQEIKDEVYNFGDDFKLILGLGDDNGKLFYIKDLAAKRAKAEWIAVGDDGYYFGSDGYALKGRQIISSDVNVFGEDYKLIKGLQKDSLDENKLFLVKDAKGTHAKNEWFDDTENSKKYYFAKDGYAAKSWQSIDGSTYYFDNDFQPVTGTQNIDGVEYKFGDDGKLADPVEIGLQLDKDTNRYKFVINPAGDLAKSEWQLVNSQAYYFDEKGLSVKDRQVIDENVYFFTDEYTLKLGLNIDDKSTGGTTAFFIEDVTRTRAISKWKEIDSKRYYFDDKALAVKGRQMIEESVFLFNDDFTLKTGLCEDPLAEGGKKLFYVSPKTGLIEKNMWIASSGAYFYIGDDGYAVTGTQVIDSITYIFTLDFTLQTGLYKDPNNGNRYRYITPNTNKIHKGWLNISGKKYYFDFLGLSVTGAYYVDGVLCEFDANHQLIETTTTGAKGIDVSSFQGVIDWAKVKSDGIDYAIIRAVHWPKGASYYQIDPYFYRNVMGAKAQGIKVGAYIYSYAFNASEGIEEALFFVNSNEVKTLRSNGVKFDLPVFIDYEDNRILENTTSTQVRTEAIRAAMVVLDQKGYYPGFYMNDNWSRNFVDTNSLLKEGYDFWLAHFDVANHKWGDKPGLWQYTSKGSVNGIGGNVDMNIMYKDYPSIINPGGGGSGGGTQPDVGEKLTVYDLNSKAYITDSWNNIVAGIVENEVGSGLGATGLDAQALYKAQAVAARTWLLFQKQVSTANPQVGIKAPRIQVMDAVLSVQNEVLKYDGSYINAAYGSASATYTNSAANMGWGARPYLISVASGYEPSGYINKVTTVGLDQMRENVERIAGAGATKNLPNEQWLTNPQFDAYGYCTSITVAGKTVTGGKFYENCRGLYSPNFKISKNGTGGEWVFVTNGNGHCVGMSQWGARNMIVVGISYKTVLETYYKGAKVTLK